MVNFQGPIVFCVVSRYHGGAFVVFSGALNDHMEVVALEGSHASVIGGAPAAAVVFARDVAQPHRRRSPGRRSPRGRNICTESERAKPGSRQRSTSLRIDVHAEKMGEVAAEFDAIHDVNRALRVGSIDRIIPPSELRPYLIDAIERGVARFLEHRGSTSSACALSRQWHRRRPDQSRLVDRTEAARIESFRYTKRRMETRLSRWTAKQAVGRALELPVIDGLDDLRAVSIRNAVRWRARGISRRRARRRLDLDDRSGRLVGVHRDLRHRRRRVRPRTGRAAQRALRARLLHPGRAARRRRTDPTPTTCSPTRSGRRRRAR